MFNFSFSVFFCMLQSVFFLVFLRWSLLFFLIEEVYRCLHISSHSITVLSFLSILFFSFLSPLHFHILSLFSLLMSFYLFFSFSLINFSSFSSPLLFLFSPIGIHFTRCVGIESIPALSTCATRTVNEMKRCMASGGAGSYVHTDAHTHTQNHVQNQVQGLHRPHSNNTPHNTHTAHNTHINGNDIHQNQNNLKNMGRTNGMNNSTAHHSTDVRAPNLLVVAANSIISGLPLLEVRYKKIYCFFVFFLVLFIFLF